MLEYLLEFRMECFLILLGFLLIGVLRVNECLLYKLLEL